MEDFNTKDALMWRYAVKEFDNTRKISESDWNFLEETLQFSPSSYGLQPWKFVVVKEDEMREKLTPFTVNPLQLKTCSHIVVFCALNVMDEFYIENWVKTLSKARNIPLESLQGYKNMMIGGVLKRTPEENFSWHKAQVYLSLGFALHTAACMKIDSCPIEGIDSKGYTEVLGLEGYTAVVMAAFGYRSEADKNAKMPKVRFPKEQVVSKI